MTSKSPGLIPVKLVTVCAFESPVPVTSHSKVASSWMSYQPFVTLSPWPLLADSTSATLLCFVDWSKGPVIPVIVMPYVLPAKPKFRGRPFSVAIHFDKGVNEWQDPKMRKGLILKRIEVLGIGGLFAIAGIIAYFSSPKAFPLALILFGIAVFKSRLLICSECGSKLRNKEVKICPACHSQLSVNPPQ